MYTFSPNTIIDSAKINSNFQGLADGTNVETAVNVDQMRKDTMFAHIVSGLAPATSGTLTTAISAGVYVDHNGKRWEVAATNKLLTASRDTYIDLYEGTYYYTEVANGASSGMALTTDYFRVAKVVTDGTSVTSVVQYGADPLYNRIGNHNSNMLVTTACDQAGAVQAITSATWTSLTNAVGVVKVVRGKLLVVTVRTSGYKTTNVGRVYYRMQIGSANGSEQQFYVNAVSTHIPLDFEWIFEGTNGNALIPPGDYSFQLQAKPENNGWSQDTGDQHKIIVKEYA